MCGCKSPHRCFYSLSQSTLLHLLQFLSPPLSSPSLPPLNYGCSVKEPIGSRCVTADTVNSCQLLYQLLVSLWPHTPTWTPPPLPPKNNNQQLQHKLQGADPSCQLATSISFFFTQENLIKINKQSNNQHPPYSCSYTHVQPPALPFSSTSVKRTLIKTLIQSVVIKIMEEKAEQL